MTVNNIVKATMGITAVAGTAYLGWRVFKIVKQYKEDQSKNEQLEKEVEVETLKAQIDKDFERPSLDDEPSEDEMSAMASVLEDGLEEDIEDEDLIEEAPEEFEKMLPMWIGEGDGRRLYTQESEFRGMHFKSDSPEAMLQYKSYLLADVTVYKDNDYDMMMELLDIQVELDIPRDENLAIEIRDNREDVFGDDAPLDMLDDVTFGEVLIALTARVNFDFGGDRLEYIKTMLDNIDWEQQSFDYGAETFAQMVVDHELTDENIINGRVGIYGLPENHLTSIRNDPDFGFWNQYQASTFGEK